MQNKDFSGSLWRRGTFIAVITVIALVLVTLFIGCPADPDDGDNNDNGNGQVSQFPMTVTDQAGREVTIESEPQRIISLAPSNTEIAFALGLDDKIVGVTTFCDYPAAALDKPKVGDIVNPDIETIVSMEPDLILTLKTAHLAQITPQLEALGLTVLTIEPQSLDEVMEGITLMGRCTGKYSEAVDLVTDMQSRINAVAAKTSGLTAEEKPGVLYILWHDPIFVVAGQSLQDELITLAGGIDLARDWGVGTAIVGFEQIVAANPEIMLADTGMGVGDLTLQFVQNEERLAIVDARINDQIYGANTDLTGVPGPRIVEGLELLAELFHPELFE